MTTQYKYDVIEDKVARVVETAKALVAAGWEPAFPMTVYLSLHTTYAVQWMRVEVA